ncbi:MAG: sugar ABC transporter ATP-binding protein [Spirochaetales bacterium]|nr:sugar ABC transporter ATP-binding protein [Spirochaetales bacterium]
MREEKTCLEFIDISMEFPGVKALSKVRMDIRRGEIHALMGANGAGKSTLIKILARIYRQTEGEIFLNGQNINGATPETIRNFGVDFIFQELELVPGFTVAQNIMIGIEPCRGPFVHWRRMEEESQRALDAFIPGAVDARSRIADLSVAKQQIVCIVRALSRNPKILVLDEPTSRLSASETEALFAALNSIRNQRELTIIYISHRLEELFRICDRVTILKDGVGAGTWDIKSLTKEDIVAKMVGKMSPPDKAKVPSPAFPGDTHQEAASLQAPLPAALEVCRIGVEGLIEDVSFEVRPGEILSIFGAVGSRKTELLEAILGIRNRSSGTVRIEGREVKLTGARSAKKHGICLLPEDRRKFGIIYDFSVRENTTLAFLKRFITRFGAIRKKWEAQTVKELCASLRVKMPSAEVKVKTLSGGNQQKIVVAKWLAGNSNIYIFDEPTVGIDVRGKSEIHEIIRRLAGEGKAVIVSSSEAEEAIGIGHRMVVLFNGCPAAQFECGSVKYEEIIFLSMGGKRNAG